MKNTRHNHRRPYLVSLLLFTAFTIGACGSDKPAAPAIQPELTPLVDENSAEEQTFQLGELVKQIQLEHVEKEIAYEERDVPATCSRTVQTGTRSECRNENQNSCHTEYENECRIVDFPVCQNVPERVCRDVPDQVCHNETFPVCRNETRQVCSTTNSCRQEIQRICDSRGCRDAPRTVCTPVRSCQNVTENVCHNETRQRCERTTRRECRMEDRRVCHNDTRQECNRVPRERCVSVPHQVCENVPTYGQESYACTQRERVAVGERVTLHQLARVRIDLKNPRNRNVTVDSAIVYLDRGRVYLEIEGENAAKYKIQKVSLTTQNISSTEQVIEASFIIEAL